MNKNSIDKFFQEKFKDFGEVPDEKVWESIETSLDEKGKKRRILPIWWRLGGIAALLAVLFYIANPFEDNGVPTVVDSDTEQLENPDSGQESQKQKDALEIPKTDNEIVQTPDENEKVDDLSNTSNAGSNAQAITAKSENEAPEVTEDGANNKLANQSIGKQETQIAIANPNSDTGELVPENDSEKQVEDLVITQKDTDVATTNVIQENDKKTNENAEEEVVAEVEVKEIIEDPEKKSIFDEINQEEEVVAESNEGKWAVGPSVAPVYFSSFGEGSPIHSNFVANSKSGNLNLSYGLSVSYAVSKKLSVRSGIHKVDYGYDTNDVSFSSSLAASTNNRIDNIDYALASKNLVVQSSADREANLDLSLASSNEIAAPRPSRDGRMVQQFGYLEVPVEMNYALIDRKLGVNIIGGVSSLFLVNNDVSLESDGGATKIGEANNINDLNFSTNIGFGINYKLTPKMQLNLEPMFKYQLNTFSDSSGSFQPFSVGVYSGLNFRF